MNLDKTIQYKKLSTSGITIELKSYGKINNILIVKSPNTQNSSILPI